MDDDRKPGDEVPPGSQQSGDAVCPKCNGAGKLAGDICPDCGGTGTITALVGDA
jgi:DnaJ-class molecular chaperone